MSSLSTGMGWLGCVVMVLGVFLMVDGTAGAAPLDGWIHEYRPGTNTAGMSVAVDRSGDVAVAGTVLSYINYEGTKSYRVHLAKYHGANGLLRWQSLAPVRGVRPNLRMVLDKDGNLVLTAEVGTSSDFYIAKFSGLNGELLWENLHSASSWIDEFFAMTLDDNGDILATGSSDGQFYTAKYRGADGTLVWDVRASTGRERAYTGHAITVDSQGNVLVTGNREHYFYTTKYAGVDGRLLWETSFGIPGPSDAGFAIGVDRNDDVFVIGESFQVNGASHMHTVKYASGNGALIWERRHEEPSVGRALRVTAEGDVIVGGAATPAGRSGSCIYLARYSGVDGRLIWDVSCDNTPDHENGSVHSLVLNGNGDVIVKGGGPSFVAKYRGGDGTVIWKVPCPANRDFWSTADNDVAVGPDGMVVATGSSSINMTTVAYQEFLPRLTLEKGDAGSRVVFTGVPGRVYTLQRAPTPGGEWTDIAELSAPLDGRIGHEDSEAGAGPFFYRVRRDP